MSPRHLRITNCWARLSIDPPVTVRIPRHELFGMSLTASSPRLLMTSCSSLAAAGSPPSQWLLARVARPAFACRTAGRWHPPHLCCSHRALRAPAQLFEPERTLRFGHFPISNLWYQTSCWRRLLLPHRHHAVRWDQVEADLWRYRARVPGLARPCPRDQQRQLQCAPNPRKCARLGCGPDGFGTCLQASCWSRRWEGLW